MEEYNCDKCGKIFKLKSFYLKHQNCQKKQIKLVKKLIKKPEIPSKKLDSKLDFKLPNTRFQGSKRKIIPTIYQLMIKHIQPNRVLDLFGGSAICSLYFQMNGIETIYNDLFQFNCINAEGFLNCHIENIPTEDQIKRIFIKEEGVNYETLIEDTFEDIYYTKLENQQLDIFRGNIKTLLNREQRNIMYYLIFQSLISKRPYNLFHRKNLSMRLSDVKRSFGNKATWDKSFVNHMCKFRLELIKLYQEKQKRTLGQTRIINHSFDQIPEQILSEIDTIYIDPPYFKKNSKNTDYFNYYHFLEGFIDDQWENKIDMSSGHRRLNLSNQYTISNANDMFDWMIENFANQNLVISYNTKSYPSVEELERKLKKVYPRVITEYIDYNYALSKSKATEILILALI